MLPTSWPRLAVLILGLALAAPGVALAHPATSQRDAVAARAATPGLDQIAYSCQTVNSPDLCLTKADGLTGGARNLTQTDTATEYGPSWSPDGKKLAFKADYTLGNSNFDVWATDPEGSASAVNINGQTSEQEVYDRPAYSPDGSRIAYDLVDDDSASATYVASADGTTTPVRIGGSSFTGRYPSWTRDGRLVMSVGTTLYVANADGTGAATAIPGGGGGWPVVSPDGTKVAAIVPGATSKVVVTKIDGSGSVTLTTASSFGARVSWSPDSTKIAYVSGDSSTTVWVAPADNSDAGHALPTPVGWGSPNLDPSWSPDGTRIAFSSQSGVQSQTQIFVAAQDGLSAPVQVTFSAQTGVFSTQPTWRPNGTNPVPPVPPGPAPGGGTAGNPVVPQTVAFVSFANPVYHNGFVGAAYVQCGKVPDANSIAAGCDYSGKGITKGAGPRLPRLGTGNAGKPKLFTFATGSVHVPNGETRLLMLKVTKAGKKLLKQKGKVTFTVTVTQASVAGAQTQKLTVKLKKRK